MSVKKCQDCKFSKPAEWLMLWKRWDFAKCQHKTSGINSEIHAYHLGRDTPPERDKPHYCATMRGFGTLCGREATLFEPRESA